MPGSLPNPASTPTVYKGRLFTLSREGDFWFAPLGDPMSIAMDGQTISLRRADAADVTVKEQA